MKFVPAVCRSWTGHGFLLSLCSWRSDFGADTFSNGECVCVHVSAIRWMYACACNVFVFIARTQHSHRAVLVKICCTRCCVCVCAVHRVCFMLIFYPLSPPSNIEWHTERMHRLAPYVYDMKRCQVEQLRLHCQHTFTHTSKHTHTPTSIHNFVVLLLLLLCWSEIEANNAI